MLLLDFLLDLHFSLRWREVLSVTAQALSLEILYQLLQSKHKLFPYLLIIDDEHAKS